MYHLGNIENTYLNPSQGLKLQECENQQVPTLAGEEKIHVVFQKRNSCYLKTTIVEPGHFTAGCYKWNFIAVLAVPLYFAEADWASLV